MSGSGAVRARRFLEGLAAAAAVGVAKLFLRRCQGILQPPRPSLTTTRLPFFSQLCSYVEDEEPASFSPSSLASSVVFSASSSCKKRRMRRQRSSPQPDSAISTQPAVVSGKDLLYASSKPQSVTPETESKVSMDSVSDIAVSVNSETAKLKTVVSETNFSSPRDLRGCLHAPSESKDALKETVITNSRI